MARNIAISDEVYELLRKSKLPGESFSAVIKRNMRKGKLSDIIGKATLTVEDWEATREQLSASEALTSERLRRENT